MNIIKQITVYTDSGKDVFCVGKKFSGSLYGYKIVDIKAESHKNERHPNHFKVFVKDYQLAFEIRNCACVVEYEVEYE